MTGMLKSPAFREFLQKRCEEITLTDEDCVKITKSIVRAGEDLTAELSPEAVSKFIYLETLTAELLSHIEPLLYLKGMIDYKCF